MGLLCCIRMRRDISPGDPVADGLVSHRIELLLLHCMLIAAHFDPLQFDLFDLGSLSDRPLPHSSVLFLFYSLRWYQLEL